MSLLLSNVAVYASSMLRGPPEYGGKFLIGRHHQEWAKVVNGFKRLCVLASRDHGKSFFFTLAYPLWIAEKNPDRETYLFSGSDPQAQRLLAIIKDEVEGNPKLKHLLPKRKDKWSANRIELANGHEIHARGYGTKVRGAHPVAIVLDDVVNDDSSFSETARNRVVEYFYSAITNMIIPGGQIIVVGTPQAYSDLYGILRTNAAYTFRKYQAIEESSGTPLWPERYSIKLLEARRDEIGSLRFAREFQCEPVSDESSLFPPSLWENALVEDSWYRLGRPLSVFRKHVDIKSVFIGVDFAISANTGADYTIIFIIGLDRNDVHWVLDIRRFHGMAFQDQLTEIRRAWLDYQADMVYVESNAMQRIFGDELVRTSDIPLHQVKTGDEKHSLEKGLPSLRVLLENSRIRIPARDLVDDHQATAPLGGEGAIVGAQTNSSGVLRVFMDECRAITFKNGRIRSIADHDDTVMGWFVAEKAIRESRFGFSFDEGEDDGTDPWAIDDEPGAIDDESDEIPSAALQRVVSSKVELYVNRPEPKSKDALAPQTDYFYGSEEDEPSGPTAQRPSGASELPRIGAPKASDIGFWR